MSREEDGAVLSKGCNAFDSWMPFDKVAMSERVVMFKSGEETMPKGSARGITGMWQSNDQRGDIGSVQESRVEKSREGWQDVAASGFEARKLIYQLHNLASESLTGQSSEFVHIKQSQDSVTTFCSTEPCVSRMSV
jgi:hypothetical protein